jgi:hypothetical protein
MPDYVRKSSRSIRDALAPIAIIVMAIVLAVAVINACETCNLPH